MLDPVILVVAPDALGVKDGLGLTLLLPVAVAPPPPPPDCPVDGLLAFPPGFP